MPPIIVGGRAYRVRATKRHAGWSAHAVRVDTGDRHGADLDADTEAAAVAAVVGWLEWQREHEAALQALQRVERAYHRTVAGHAFSPAADQLSIREERRAMLEAVDQARATLDLVRARAPRA